MLKYKEANPLEVFGLRRVDHCPPHFVKFTFDSYIAEKAIVDWIYENLTGRFYFGEYYSKDSNNISRMSKCAAFEIPGEASYFALQIDVLTKQLLSQ
jgi:hypothetical protein